jgi:hypothetical protein
MSGFVIAMALLAIVVISTLSVLAEIHGGENDV